MLNLFGLAKKMFNWIMHPEEHPLYQNLFSRDFKENNMMLANFVGTIIYIYDMFNLFKDKLVDRVSC